MPTVRLGAVVSVSKKWPPSPFDTLCLKAVVYWTNTQIEHADTQPTRLILSMIQLNCNFSFLFFAKENKKINNPMK